MEISSRQSDILKLIIDEYVKNARPVSSVLIRERSGLGVCSATIRIEMGYLGDEGYIQQTHISSGRIPTDMGYRYLVDALEERNEKNITITRDSIWETLSALVRLMSDETSLLAIGGVPSKKLFVKEGWGQLLREPEFEGGEMRLRLAKMMELFEEGIGKMREGVHVLIGDENPFDDSDEFSIVTGGCVVGDESGVIGIVGPKRMRYMESIRMVKAAQKFLQDCT